MYVILKFRNIPTNALYYNLKLLHLKNWDSDMFRPFLLGYPQGMHISIYIKKGHYCVHKSSPQVPMLSQLNPVHSLTTYFHETQFSIVLSFILCSQYCFRCLFLCQWLRAFLRRNHVALGAEFYVMIIWVCWVMAVLWGEQFSVFYRTIFRSPSRSEGFWKCLELHSH